MANSQEKNLNKSNKKTNNSNKSRKVTNVKNSKQGATTKTEKSNLKKNEAVKKKSEIKNQEKQRDKKVVDKDVVEVKNNNEENSEKHILIEQEENQKEINLEDSLGDSVQEKNNHSVEFKDEEKTNKLGFIVFLALLLIIVGICVFYEVNEKSEKKSDVSTEESNEIMDDFYKYYNSKKAKVIYYASSSCGYCQLEGPIMEQIDKDYNIDYLYIDSTKLSNSDREKMLKDLEIEHATPTTVVVKNGEILGTQVGYLDGKEMVEFLKENKILDNDAVYTPEQYLTFINYTEYNNLLSKQGKHILTIGQTGCSHCIATKPVLNKIAGDYNIQINYLNLTDMSNSEVNSFTNSLSEIGYDEEEFVSSGNFGTPLTLIIENGKVISYVSGERPTTQFIKAFKKAGIIEE